MASKSNPILESIALGLLSTLGEPGLESLLQHLVDKDKNRAKILLPTISQAITAVAKKNKIKL